MILHSSFAELHVYPDFHQCANGYEASPWQQGAEIGL